MIGIPRDGYWRLYGSGPDKYVFNTPEGGLFDYSGNVAGSIRNYDPTNGTNSIGDIFRMQKSGDTLDEGFVALP